MKKFITFLLAITFAYSCSTSSDDNGNSSTTDLPTLTTAAVSSIAATTAISGGNITSDGGAAIIAKGVCWSTNANPTIALSTKTTDDAGTGFFTSNITGLTANTIYFLRAYATNSIGTAYGNQLIFTTLQGANGINITGPNLTDIDGNTYQSVTNCGQTWTQRNLNVSKYSDGTPIPQVDNSATWQNLTTGAWCYYNNDPANEAIYGKLYNWYAVAGIHDANSSTPNKVLAPQGWHIPSDIDWIALTTCLGGESVAGVAGGKMKSTGTSLWLSPNAAATNLSGFTGLPGGYRSNFGAFSFIGSYGNWWSSSEFITFKAWDRSLSYTNATVGRNDSDQNYGFSVRCIKD